MWANSRRWWRTGKPGMLQSMRSQRVEHDWAAVQQQQIIICNLQLRKLSRGTWPSSHTAGSGRTGSSPGRLALQAGCAPLFKLWVGCGECAAHVGALRHNQCCYSPGHPSAQLGPGVTCSGICSFSWTHQIGAQAAAPHACLPGRLAPSLLVGFSVKLLRRKTYFPW